MNDDFIIAVFFTCAYILRFMYCWPIKYRANLLILRRWFLLSSPLATHSLTQLGMKTVGNDRENSLTVSATVFFGRERKQERKNRTGKRNRYYGISGTESIGREHADYDRESITQRENTYNHFKHLTR